MKKWFAKERRYSIVGFAGCLALAVAVLLSPAAVGARAASMPTYSGFYNTFEYPAFTAVWMQDNDAAVVDDAEVRIEPFTRGNALLAEVTATYRVRATAAAEVELGLPFYTLGNLAHPTATVDGQSVGAARFGQVIDALTPMTCEQVRNACLTTLDPTTVAYLYTLESMADGASRMTVNVPEDCHVIADGASIFATTGLISVRPLEGQETTLLSVGGELTFPEGVTVQGRETTCAQYFDALTKDNDSEDADYFRDRLYAAVNVLLKGTKRGRSLTGLCEDAERVVLGVHVVPLSLSAGESRTVTYRYQMSANMSADYQTPLYAFYHRNLGSVAAKVRVKAIESSAYMVESNREFRQTDGAFDLLEPCGDDLYFVLSEVENPQLKEKETPQPQPQPQPQTVVREVIPWWIWLIIAILGVCAAFFAAAFVWLYRRY